MDTHELARVLLAAPVGKIVCSVDLSTCEDNVDRRAFGEFVEINQLPSSVGFGSGEAVLLFDGSLNDY